MPNAFGILGRVLKGRAVDDSCRVEDSDIGIGADLDAAFDAHRGNGLFQTPGGQQRHFANRVHQRESILLTNINPKHAREAACPAWMPLAVFDQTIAGDDDARVSGGKARDLFGDRMADDRTALFAVTRESFRRQPFAGRHPLQVFECNTELLLPALVVDGRFEARLRRRVGISLRRDVQAAPRGAFDHAQAGGSLPQAHAGNVHHVQRCAGADSIGQDFL